MNKQANTQTSTHTKKQASHTEINGRALA